MIDAEELYDEPQFRKLNCPICHKKVRAQIIKDGAWIRTYKCPNIGKDNIYHTFDKYLTFHGWIFETIEKDTKWIRNLFKK